MLEKLEKLHFLRIKKALDCESAKLIWCRADYDEFTLYCGCRKENSGQDYPQSTSVYESIDESEWSESSVTGSKQVDYGKGARNIRRHNQSLNVTLVNITFQEYIYIDFRLYLNEI